MTETNPRAYQEALAPYSRKRSIATCHRLELRKTPKQANVVSVFVAVAVAWLAVPGNTLKTPRSNNRNIGGRRGRLARHEML